MNPLQLRLASLRRRLHMVTLWRGLCGIFALAAGAAVVVGLFDWYVNLPSVVRALALVGILGAAGYVFLRWLCLPLTTRCDDLTLALRIEEVYPELNDCLASTVQFLEEPEGSTHSSPALRKQAVEQAMKQADDCDFNRILDRRGVWMLGLAALVTGALAWYFGFGYPYLARTALVRLADPFGGHTWTQLSIPSCPEKIAQGQHFLLKGELTGIVPVQARLEIEGRLDKTIAIKKDAGQQTGVLVAPLDVTQQKGKFRFRILAGDAAFPTKSVWQDVEVLPPPRLTMLDGMPSPQIELRYPRYTDLPSPRKLSPGQGGLEAIAGTHVTLRAAVDRPLSDAWIELQPERSVLRDAALVGPLGHASPLEMLALAHLGNSVAGRVSCQLDNTGTQLSTRFVAWLPGQYWLRFQDHDALANDYKNELRIFTDPPPGVTLQRPGSSLSLLPDAQVTFKMRVEDEIFAVRSVYLEYRRKNAEGHWLDDQPVRLPILDHDMIDREVPALLSVLARTNGSLPPIARPSPLITTLHLRPRQVELSSVWPLRSRFKEGESIVLQVCADDFNDLFEPRAIGRSHEVEVRIVGKAELAKQFDEDFAKVQQELVRLQHMQDEALRKVDEVRADRDKAGTKAAHDKLVEVEQLQRQIQERVGQRKDEALRQEIGNLQQKMRDNQLPPSEMEDRMRTLASELDRMVREDLQQIEAKLSEARKEAAAGKKTPAKNKDALEEARTRQQDAKKTLDELASFLDPWANMHQIKGRTRDLLTKQKDLKKETDALTKNKMPKDEFRAELNKQADSQKSLTGEAEALLKTMRDVKDKETGNSKDPSDTAAKVGRAIDAAEKGQLTTKMKQARQDLDPKQDNPKPGDASTKQNEAIETLKKVVAALEDERRDEDIDKLRKKQKKAEEKLDQIAEDMDRLQKKVKKASQIADPQERAEELKKLAREQEKLKDEAQEHARELARLRAEKASRELARAAQEMDRAARTLDAGEDPGEMQEEALQRIEEAQAKLEDAEEELAREQLARIADRIKGLKERQDTAVAESERIHKELKRAGQWSQGTLGSLKNSATTQRGLEQEASSLKEKLKDAKVFEHILDRAARSMTQAAEAIDERAKDKAYDPLEKEEMTAENQAHDRILKQQKLAAGRLQRLVDALKNDPAVAQDQPKKEDGAEKPMGGGEEQGMKLRGGDGIPPVAQLKALREEQSEVQQRTKEFDERHPDRANLTNEQRRELTELENDQTRIGEIFSGLTSKKRGEEPVTRILGTFLAGVTLTIFLAAQEPAAGKDDPDQLGKDAVRISNAIADALEAVGKNPDLKTIEANQEKVKKLQAEFTSIGKKISALPPDVQKGLESKYKKSIESALERSKKAAEKLGLKDLPNIPDRGAAKPDRTQELVKRLNENLEKAADRLNKQDPGKDTVKIQDDIVKDLDELIKQQQNQDSSSSSASSSSSSSSQSGGAKSAGKRTRSQASSKSQKQEKLGGGQDKKDPKESSAKNGAGKDDKDKKDSGGALGSKKKDSKNTIADLERFKDIWGHLPQTKRQEMEAYSRERFMPRYEDLLRQYYRTIAEQGRKD